MDRWAGAPRALTGAVPAAPDGSGHDLPAVRVLDPAAVGAALRRRVVRAVTWWWQGWIAHVRSVRSGR